MKLSSLLIELGTERLSHRIEPSSLRGPALKQALIVLVLIFLCGSRMAAAGQDAIVFNEIMHHPVSENASEQWVELYNPGASDVDLSRWQIVKDVAFTFPTGTRIAAGGYLVVAADRTAFTANHPGVSNLVAGWTGTLRHSLELRDISGQSVNSLEFFTDGDWSVRVLGEEQYGHRGWEWFAPNDGGGASLELLNPKLPNTYSQNWAPNKNNSSTPGQPNSIASANIAPFISGVIHSPVLPRSSEAVTVTARILDEDRQGPSVILNWRVDGQPAFLQIPMLDDGKHGDGLADDGIYGAVLPSEPDKTIVEFFIHAQDAAGNGRSYPNFVQPVDSPRTANLLYQVDDSIENGSQPVYRIIMTEVERAELYALGRRCPDSDSDAMMNATWITDDGVVSGGTTTQSRYNVGVRNRGHGSRQSNPNNYHLEIPSDRVWKNQSGINLNSQHAFSQVLGSAIFRRAGLSMPNSRPVQVRVDGTNLMAVVPNNSFGSYAANEQYNGDFIKRTFPLDPNGNSYRGIRDSVSCDPSFNGVADFSWHGTDYAVGVYTNAYFKQNNFEQNDWSDLIRLIGVLNLTNGTTAASYVNDVRQVLNVEEWMRYMAVNTLLDNTETSLANGFGDDYALYRGIDDPRFQVLPYDLDSLMGTGSRSTSPRDGIFKMTPLPAIDRFMKTPGFSQIYYRELESQAKTLFSSQTMNPLIDEVLASFVPQDALDNMKAFNASQVDYVLSQIPVMLTATSSLPVVNGYVRSTEPAVPLAGSANAIKTYAVLVNGSTAQYSDWQGSWSISNVSLQPGVNRVLVQALDAEGAEIERTNLDVWYDTGTTAKIGTSLTGSNVWSAANGPYLVSSSLTLGSGVTLKIEPGTTVYLGAGANLTVANGGQLLAEGTETAPIRFTREPGATASWGGVVINGTGNSPETRITYSHFEFNGSTAIHSSGGTVFLDHLTFGNTDNQYISLDGSSFVVSHCVFPTPTAGFELVHGTGGIKSGGHGVFVRNFFGKPNGYNDVVDFTGGNRPGPIVHFIDNVFTGASDDILDLDGTDAWVEGNIFLHAHKNGTPDSSSAVSGGNDNGNTSEVTIIGNLFYDCDQIATAKQGNFFTLINNTIVHQTHQGGLDTQGAVINMADAGTTEGSGMYLEGNIIYDAEALVRDQTVSEVTFTNNLMSLPWTGPGGANSAADPLFKHVPQLSETEFGSWAEAQIMRDWFSLLSGSPAKGTGPNRNDKGGVIPIGASISGEPIGTNQQASAVLTIGTARSGSGIPAAGWPDGSGYTHYQWSLDDGPWSPETPIAASISLNGLANGMHHVSVIGRRDSGLYQNDPIFAPDTVVSVSRSWTVGTNANPAVSVRINELLAANTSILTNAATTPDLVELYNGGTSAVDLTGYGLSDADGLPYRFTFPTNTSLSAGGYLVLYADNETTLPGMHLGFGLNRNGGSLWLRSPAAQGGTTLDSVQYGIQISDFSVGRAGDGSWILCVPTPGTPNIAQPLGDARQLRINEWLSDEQFVATDDFIELYNPGGSPTALGGLYLSDAAGAPDLHSMAPLSFIPAHGFASLTADGNANAGANHLNFKLSADVGIIGLYAPDLSPIDIINYGAQRTDIAQGRSPDGSDAIAYFVHPTPGGPNPGLLGSVSTTNITAEVQSLINITNTVWRYDNSGVDMGTAWRLPAFDDSNWSSGTGLFGFETTPAEYPYPFATTIPAPDRTGGHGTVYYRTHFQWTNSPTQFQLIATNYLDDGAVFYLNGVEAGRIRISANPVLYSSSASNQGNEGGAETLTFAATNLVEGDNVAAVEVHQSGGNSSDDVFGMSLAATRFMTNIVTQTFGTPLLINEVMAANRSFTNMAGTTADWVEIYNPSTNVADLSNMGLSNDSSDPLKWAFQPNTHIAPGGFLVVFFTGAAPASSTNTGFGLNASGDSIFLFDSQAGGGGLIDEVSFGVQTPDYSIGRIPDGVGTWALNVPTLGASNTRARLGDLSLVRINEWMAAPVFGEDWFELANLNQDPVDLSGAYLSDELDVKDKFRITPLSFIGAGRDGFLKIDADDAKENGATHASFKLSTKGDAIGLFGPDQSMIHSVIFGPQLSGKSQGFVPDGSTNLVTLAFPTPGESNEQPSGDVDSDHDGLPDAWELAHGLNPNDPNDAVIDSDQDGLSNLEEYLSGTDPRDRASNLALGVEASNGSARITFSAVAGKSYTIEYKNSLTDTQWQVLASIPSQAQNSIVSWPDSPQGETRFYRLVVNAAP